MKIEVYCSAFCGNSCTPPMPYATLKSLDKIKGEVEYHFGRHPDAIVTVIVKQ